MNHAQQQIRKLAVELYEQALEDGEDFDLADLVERLIADLMTRYTADDRSVVRELIEITARDAVKYVDGERTKPTEQPTLLDDLDRSIPVGPSTRRVRRHMKAAHWAIHLAYVNANAARVNAAAAKENRWYAELASYLASGMDTEQAVAAWQADHPKEVLG